MKWSHGSVAEKVLEDLAGKCKSYMYLAAPTAQFYLNPCELAWLPLDPTGYFWLLDVSSGKETFVSLPQIKPQQ